MKTTIVVYTIAGLLFGACLALKGQVPASDSLEAPKNAAGPAKPDTASARKKIRTNTHFTGGQLTLPFKIRPKAATNSFRLTTDVTLGGYFGICCRLSQAKNYSMTIPLTAGLTFINVNNNNTTVDRGLEDAEVIPGITWSTGLILQLDQYNLGVMFGKDYASEIGNQWIYHGKIWWSFGVGFAFLQ